MKFKTKNLFLAIRKFAYGTLGFVDYRVLKKANLVSILAYHSIAEDDWKFSIDEETMKRQISYLKKHYQLVSLDTVEKFLQGKTEITKPSITLTFDDGYRNILSLKDYFKKQNIKPALFVIADPENVNIAQIGKENSYLNIKEIKSLIAAGWEIGSHSMTHPDLQKLTDSQLRDEIVLSKKSLENSLGVKIKYFSYPKGRYSTNVLFFVKEAGYGLGLSMDDGFIKNGIDPLTIPRIGIDKTHTFSEFKSAFSPSTIMARKFIKSTFIGRYL